jgi:hypothetical protein
MFRNKPLDGEKSPLGGLGGGVVEGAGGVFILPFICDPRLREKAILAASVSQPHRPYRLIGRIIAWICDAAGSADGRGSPFAALPRRVDGGMIRAFGVW